MLPLFVSPLVCAHQCAILNEKLDSLLQTLNTECQALPSLPHSTPPIVEEEQEEEEEEEEASVESLTELKEKLEEEETEKGHQLFKSREQLMLRANSLKKAVRQIIEQAERGNTCCIIMEGKLRTQFTQRLVKEMNCFRLAYVLQSYLEI